MNTTKGGADKAGIDDDGRCLEQYREELESINLQLEQAISRANEMALMSELANAELQQIFSNAADGIRVIDRNHNVVRFNATFQEISGLAAGIVEHGKCFESFPCHLCNTADCPLPRIVSGAQRTENEVEKIAGDDDAGTFFIVRARPFLAPDGELLGIVEYILDITARKRAEQALLESERRYRELSVKDELTGLYNKRYLNIHLPLETVRAKRYNHPLAFFLMDIDNFKHHNDTYGHADGDKVLARLGLVIAGAVRSCDIACRFGGEEFAVILPDTDGDQAMVVAERIRRNFAELEFYPHPGEKVQKTISIGIAQYIAGESEDVLLERADSNMYLAKQQGKNCLVLR
jgi:two-component system cell cycle response regulator